MAFNETYRRQVALLIRTLPQVAEEKSFALKGGTAINLFIRDMPRLSVDIDLTYLPVQPRTESLAAIAAALKRIKDRLVKTIDGAQVTEGLHKGSATKLLVRAAGVQIKIEVTPVLRGCVYSPELRSVSRTVEEAFGFAEIQIVSFPDLYAGKIVAALDRQHPRDFFDIRDLLANEGIDDELRRAFIVYLLSHDRPMWEVLAAKSKYMADEYARGFEGMTATAIALPDLANTRDALIADIVGNMPQEHRHFLISFERGDPDWTALKVPDATELPAVRWRQQNLDKTSAEKRAALVANIQRVLRPND